MLNKLIVVTKKFSPNRRKIISNTAWLLVDRILRLGVGLFVGVWVARYLGPAQFGLFNYVVAFFSLFCPLASLGLDGIVVRDIVRDPSSKDKTLGTTFTLKLIGGIVTLLLTVGIISLLRPGDNLSRWLVGITAAGMIFQAFDTIDLWFQSQVQSKYTVCAKNTAFVLTTLIKIALIKTRAPLIAFACTGLAEIVLGAVGLVIAYRLNRHYLIAWRVSIMRARELLKDSWPLIFSSLAIMVYMRVDQIMLGQMAGDKAVGIYSAAVRISEAWYFIPAAIGSSVFPSIIEAKNHNESLYYRRLQNFFNLMVGLGYAVAIPMTFLSGTLILFLFGKSYDQAGTVLAVHIWAAMFVFLGVAQEPWNITEGLMKLSLQRTLVGAIINIILNIILIPLYSGLGSAIATVISYACAAFLMNAFDKRTRRIFYMQIKALLLRGWSK